MTAKTSPSDRFGMDDVPSGAEIAARAAREAEETIGRRGTVVPGTAS